MDFTLSVLGPATSPHSAVSGSLFRFSIFIAIVLTSASPSQTGSCLVRGLRLLIGGSRPPGCRCLCAAAAPRPGGGAMALHLRADRLRPWPVGASLRGVWRCGCAVRGGRALARGLRRALPAVAAARLTRGAWSPRSRRVGRPALLVARDVRYS